MASSPESTDLFVFVSLMRGGRVFLTDAQRSRYTSSVLSEISRRKKAQKIDRQEEMRLLVALRGFDPENEALERSIRRKLTRVTRSAPEVARGLVPRDPLAKVRSSRSLIRSSQCTWRTGSNSVSYTLARPIHKQLTPSLEEAERSL